MIVDPSLTRSPRTIHNEAAESIDYPFKITPDPTGSTPRFALSLQHDTNPGTWVNGAWQTVWNAATKEIVATSPTIGGDAGAADLEMAPGTTCWVWYSIAVGSEKFIGVCDVIECP